MQRRDYMKTVGGIGVGTALGAGGLLAASGSAAAGESNIEHAGTSAVTTDDGSVQFVAFGGLLQYTWDGLDTPAQYGEYTVEARLLGDHFDDGATGWRHFGTSAGALDESWGSDNEQNSGPGTEGFFRFKYGSGYGQRDYAVAYNDDVGNSPENYGPNGLLLVDNPFELRHFETDEDGESKTTTIEFRFTCRVYDGNPNEDGTQVGVEDSDTAKMPVKVTNRAATGTVGGELDGTVGADES